MSRDVKNGSATTTLQSDVPASSGQNGGFKETASVELRDSRADELEDLRADITALNAVLELALGREIRGPGDRSGARTR